MASGSDVVHEGPNGEPKAIWADQDKSKEEDAKLFTELTESSKNIVSTDNEVSASSLDGVIMQEKKPSELMNDYQSRRRQSEIDHLSFYGFEGEVLISKEIPTEARIVPPWRREFYAQVHLLLDDPESSALAKRILIIIMTLIVLSCCSFIAETLPGSNEYTEECKQCQPIKESRPSEYNNSIDEALEHRWTLKDYCKQNNCEPSPKYHYLLIEAICCYVFGAEYMLRFLTAWSVPSRVERDRADEVSDGTFHTFRVLRRTYLFFVDPMNMIDVIAVVPFYIPDSLSLPSTTFLRILRLFRILKLMRIMSSSEKLKAFTEGTEMVIEVFAKAYMALTISLLFAAVFVVLMASLIFVVESGSWDPATGLYYISSKNTWYETEQDQPSQYVSIPASMWWVVVTITTVGYGDVTPKTAGGQLIALICMLGGVVLFALPLTIIGGTFQTIYDEKQDERAKLREMRIKCANIMYTFIRGDLARQVNQCFTRWKSYALSHILSDREMMECNMLMMDVKVLLANNGNGDTRKASASIDNLSEFQLERMLSFVETQETFIRNQIAKRRDVELDKRQVM